MSNKDLLWKAALLSPGRRLRQRIIFKETNLKGQILDCGCGIGITSYLLKKAGAEPKGIDIDTKLINLAKKMNPDLPFFVGKIEKIPFKKAFFNAVIASEVLEHINQEKKALMEIQRILKVGGKLLLTVPADQSLWCYQLLKVRPGAFGHQRLYNLSALKKLLIKKGFEIEKAKLIQNPFVCLSDIFLSKIVKKISKLKKSNINPTCFESIPKRYQILIFIALIVFRFLFPLLVIAESFCPQRFKTGILILAKKGK